MKKALLALLLALGVSTAAFCGLDEGVAAYQAGHYTRALQEFKPLAEQGHAQAQFNLGVMYSEGQGVAQDDRQAVDWFRKAAEQGFAGAQNNLGAMYDKGRGVAQDDRQAVDWYRKAAEQGFAKAQNNLGAMCFTGQGVAQNRVLAYMLWNLAAIGGDETAAENLAVLEKALSPGQIKKAQALAAAWKPGMALPTSSKSGAGAKRSKPSRRE